MHADTARHGGSNEKGLVTLDEHRRPGAGRRPARIAVCGNRPLRPRKAELPFPHRFPRGARIGAHDSERPVDAARYSEEIRPVDFLQRRTAMIKRPILAALAATLFAIFGLASAPAQTHTPSDPKATAA